MKLEYRYGQAYWIDLKAGDIIPTSCGNFITLKESDIENGMLKNNITISNGIDNSKPSETIECLERIETEVEVEE